MKTVSKFKYFIRLSLVLGDIFFITVIYYFSFWIRSKTSFLFFKNVMPYDRINWVTHHLGILILFHLVFMYFHGLYDRFQTYSFNEIIAKIFQSVSLEVLLLVAFYFFQQDIGFPRSIFILIWIFNFLVSTTWHLLWYVFFKKRLPIRNLLIVGETDATKSLLSEIERMSRYKLNVVGILSDEEPAEEKTFMGIPVIGSKKDILKLVNEYNIDEVIISSEGTWQEQLIDQISKMEYISARISIIPSCYEILIGKINHLKLYDIPLIEVIKHPHLSTRKRLFDFILALILIILCSPLFLLTAVLVKLSSEGPILFKQKRVGKNRKSFTIYKFRTFYHNSEEKTGPMLAHENDQYITTIGKHLRRFRLDELPQLFNILKGNMSFVGPRPERPFFVDKYFDVIPGYGERFKALPGLTGLAQVHGGYATSPENKLKYDLAYIYNQSFWLDVRIIIETIKVIFIGKTNI